MSNKHEVEGCGGNDSEDELNDNFDDAGNSEKNNDKEVRFKPGKPGKASELIVKDSVFTNQVKKQLVQDRKGHASLPSIPICDVANSLDMRCDRSNYP